ncbi:MAG: 2-oxoacid:acceptor oxidoreductase family protein [Gammaproteobacteria bacterium]|nr:2-oxoacid:acceptor oxidoreductase family protein [Gammaproteobacteria bacterium]
MLEIRIHGRGGQGNVVAAYLLATAAIGEGRYAQAFPAFGAERRGAPVVAFTRIGTAPIHRRCQVLQPAFLIVQDRALLHVPGVLNGLKAGGGILVNANDRPDDEDLGDADVVTLPATALANEYLGRPVPNTALLAAFLSLTGMLPVAALTNALGERFTGKVLERNTALVENAASQVDAGRWQEVAHAAGA